MDNTARLRAQKEAIEEMQKGEKKLGKRNFSQADIHFRRALRKAPNDYAALIYISTSQLIQKNYTVGRQYAEMAQKVYPQEAQAYHFSGFAKIHLKDFEGAYEDFNIYEGLLPGNPNTIFFKGYCQEKMEHVPEAAKEYRRYLQFVQQGEYATYAYRRMNEWGYAR
jgi:tetratricopeptide (TPR) repeat protein